MTATNVYSSTGCEFTSRDKNKSQRTKFHNRLHPDHAPEWTSAPALSPLAALTPAQIDTELSQLDAVLFKSAQYAAAALASIHWELGDRGTYVTKSRKDYQLSHEDAVAKARQRVADTDPARPWKTREMTDRLARFDKHTADAAATEGRMDELENEFRRRGGWTRAFLVLGNDGHIHRHMTCSTCRWTTQFGRLAQYSGHTEDEIVADAGERACTVCYPTAPVNVLAAPSKIAKQPRRN